MEDLKSRNAREGRPGIADRLPADDGRSVYGVTVRNENKSDPYDLSKSFNSLKAAKKYIHKVVMDDKHGKYEDNPTKG